MIFFGNLGFIFTSVSTQDVLPRENGWFSWVRGHPTTKGEKDFWLGVCTTDCWYIMVTYNTIVHTAQQWQWRTLVKLCPHEWHPMSRPYGRAMGCLSWVIQRKMTVIYQEHTEMLKCSHVMMSSCLRVNLNN